jgi:hypothetical protein
MLQIERVRFHPAELRKFWMPAKFLCCAVSVLTTLAPRALAQSVPPPPQGTQTDAAFADSFKLNHVTNVFATTQRTSCYTPEVPYAGNLGPTNGYTGETPCNGSANTGEDLGPYPTQNVANRPVLVKDHSESDLRVDPANPSHLIGQTKWFLSAEGYNHLLGFYESFDGGKNWSAQGHVPGYEGFTDNTDPVGAFDAFGNYHALLLPYQFSYDDTGGQVFNNGSSLPNPALPAEAISSAVRPRGAVAATAWEFTHNGSLDYLMTASNAHSNDPDKQWITVDLYPSSPHYNRIYAMWTLFAFNPSSVFISFSDANVDGSHTDWSPPAVLPSINGHPWDSYMLPHATPDGTVYTTETNNPAQQGFQFADLYVIASHDGGVTWQTPLLVHHDIFVPTYRNTTFREGIVNTFAVGHHFVNGRYPLYISWEDGSAGVSNIYLTSSTDGGASWSAPIVVNDNGNPVDELQPNLNVADDGVTDTVSVAFYDRRLACPAAGSAEAISAGIALDPGTAASPGAPYGRANYCINTAIQFYTATLQAIGHNIRLSQQTWDPQLNAPHPRGIGSSETFIGDYFGNTSSASTEYTTSVSTFDDGSNQNHYQQQVVASLPIPKP